MTDGHVGEYDTRESRSSLKLLQGKRLFNAYMYTSLIPAVIHIRIKDLIYVIASSDFTTYFSSKNSISSLPRCLVFASFKLLTVPLTLSILASPTIGITPLAEYYINALLPFSSQAFLLVR
jgi:hypothetical protein